MKYWNFQKLTFHNIGVIKIISDSIINNNNDFYVVI